MITTPCPRCGGKLIPCIYGYPSPQLERKAADGQVKLMGCVIRDKNPTCYCTQCGAYDPRPETGDRHD